MFRDSGRLRFLLGLALPIAVLTGLSGGVLAQDRALAMLSGLSKGEWTIRFRGDKPTRRVCLRSGEELIQIQHQDRGCSRVIVSDAADMVTVQYTCRGNGYGRTSVRRETRELVQIDGQGIAGDRPFRFYAEARRTGECR